MAVAVMGSIPGMVARRSLNRVAPMPSHDLRLDGGDLRVERADPIGNLPQHLTRDVRHPISLKFV
jgi:hypothetical protein